MKNVLIINQSAELYGADRALLELIDNYPEGYNPIVVLHQEGPLKEILEQRGIKVIKCSVVKVKRGILRPSFFLVLPFDVLKAFSTIRRELDGMKIDLVHSNAISVFIGAFYAFTFRIKHIWHVHEIIEHPAMLAKMYPKIVHLLADKIVFNSEASYSQFKKYKQRISEKSVVVHNGQTRDFPVIDADERRRIRTDLFKVRNQNTVVLGLVGRISRLKGQRLLLKAFNRLHQKFDAIHLVYVGSAPDGQEHFLEKLKTKISAEKLEHVVTIVDFQQFVWPIYDALDIVVVPSTEPESFGLVATEAMLSRKPVVGSNFGGLTEIIDDGVTGYLFEPKNVDDLVLKLEKIISDPVKLKSFGDAGYQRVISKFSATQYASGIKAAYDSFF